MVNKKFKNKKVKIDKTAFIGNNVNIDLGSIVWGNAFIGNNSTIGKNCVIGNSSFIDRNVTLGSNVVVHTNAMIYNGVIIEDNCFIGPGVCFTNDKYPKSGKKRNLKNVSWKVGSGTSIGANSTILPDINIGKNCIIGAGSLVNKDLPDNSIAFGNPIKFKSKKINK
tara:strand:- start:89 stop:589 length:501 start_codon:yes stop_codon:yes gene_type:complete